MTFSFRVQRWCYYRLWFPVWSLIMNLRIYATYPGEWSKASLKMADAKAELFDAFEFATENPVINEPIQYAIAAMLRTRVQYREDEAHDWQCWPRTTLLRGVGDCEDFAALAVWALRLLGIRAKVWRLFGPDVPAHTVAISDDWHWVVAQYRTIDLWEWSAKTGETHLPTALCAFYGGKYKEVWR